MSSPVSRGYYKYGHPSRQALSSPNRCHLRRHHPLHLQNGDDSARPAPAGQPSLEGVQQIGAKAGDGVGNDGAKVVGTGSARRQRGGMMFDNVPVQTVSGDGEYTAVLVVPTGIGAAIGGYAGDALPVAR